MNLYGGMMVFNNMVPPYILVDWKWRLF